jgi:hypothetical protein
VSLNPTNVVKQKNGTITGEVDAVKVNLHPSTGGDGRPTLQIGEGKWDNGDTSVISLKSIA